MYASNVKTQFRHYRKARICQGDIFRDLDIASGAPISAVEVDVEIESDSNYWIVINQDCDLNQDYKQRKENKIRDDVNIRTILICPAYPARQFFAGDHIEDWDLKSYGKKKIDKIKNNDEYKRYHYLEGNTSLGVPELVIDFKHFYTIPVETAYKQRLKSYLVTLNELHREDLNQRFCSFLSRIGLPDSV